MLAIMHVYVRDHMIYRTPHIICDISYDMRKNISLELARVSQTHNSGVNIIGAIVNDRPLDLIPGAGAIDALVGGLVSLTFEFY